MSRVSPYLLLTCFTFAGLFGGGAMFAAPLCAPTALALLSSPAVESPTCLPSER